MAADHGAAQVTTTTVTPDVALASAAFDLPDGPGRARHYEIDLHPTITDGHGTHHVTATISGWGATGRWHRWHCHTCADTTPVTFGQRGDCDLDRAAHESGIRS